MPFSRPVSRIASATSDAGRQGKFIRPSGLSAPSRARMGDNELMGSELLEDGVPRVGFISTTLTSAPEGLASRSGLPRKGAPATE
jgi:hypothetical protein